MTGLDKRLKKLEDALNPSGPPVIFFWDQETGTPREAYVQRYGEPFPENLIIIHWLGNDEQPTSHPVPWPEDVRVKSKEDTRRQQ